MRTLFQERDLFFMDEQFYNCHQSLLKNVIVLPKGEFKAHHVYNTIHANCCYYFWNIKYDFVIVGEEGWYERQNNQLKEELRIQQIKLGSQMVWKGELITIKKWLSFSEELRTEIIEQRDEIVSSISFDNIPTDFQVFHGIYPKKHGANCFAAAMYGVTRNKYILEEWMHQETFKLMMKRNEMVERDFIYGGSVIVFYDEKNIHHACYMIDDCRCFNKSGQMFNNPWHIADIKDVIANWSDYKYKVFNNHKNDEVMK